MTFESGKDVVATIRQYSDQSISLYEHFQLRTRDPEVQYCLSLAIDQERALQRSLTEHEATTVNAAMSEALIHAQFKWHDRTLLFRALDGLRDQRVVTKEQAIALISTCHTALCDYYKALTASTNSAEVLRFLESLRSTRERETKACAWRAIQGMTG